MEIEGAIDIGEIFYILSTGNLDNIACGGVNRIKRTVNREGIIIVGIAEIEAIAYPGKLVKVSGIILVQVRYTQLYWLASCGVNFVKPLCIKTISGGEIEGAIDINKIAGVGTS